MAAGELLAASDDDFMARGALGTFLRLGDALPPEVVRADPRLGIALAAAAGFTGRLDRVAPLLDAVDPALTDDAAPPVGWRSARAAALRCEPSTSSRRGRRTDPRRGTARRWRSSRTRPGRAG